MTSDTLVDILLLVGPVIVVIVFFWIMHMRMSRAAAPSDETETRVEETDSSAPDTEEPEPRGDKKIEADPGEESEPPELAAVKAPEDADVEKALKDLQTVTDQILAEKVSKVPSKSKKPKSSGKET